MQETQRNGNYWKLWSWRYLMCNFPSSYGLSVSLWKSKKCLWNAVQGGGAETCLSTSQTPSGWWFMGLVFSTSQSWRAHFQNGWFYIKHCPWKVQDRLKHQGALWAIQIINVDFFFFLNKCGNKHLTIFEKSPGNRSMHCWIWYCHEIQYVDIYRIISESTESLMDNPICSYQLSLQL